MRKLLPLILSATIMLNHCVMPSDNNNEKMVDTTTFQPNDTFHLLCEYWKITDAENPTAKDVSFKKDNGIEMDCGIVFMTDSTVLENPTGEMTYGKFFLHGDTINVNYEDGRKAVYLIQQINKKELKFRRTERKHTSYLTYEATETFWPQAPENPFSKQNYQWVRKPTKPESDDEIKDRVKESVKFYQYYFKGFVNGNADKIIFSALPDCLNWYQGGITIQNEENLDKKWINCFFSKEQALKGRQILQDALLKKYNWNEKEINWIKQTASVLQQIHDSI